MRIEEEKIQLEGKELVLRNAEESEAELLIEYMATVTAETRFLLCESDEFHYTPEEEKNFIREHNDSEDSLLMVAFLDGKHIGNCSFNRINTSRRNYHRAGIGIVLYQEYTGFGYGKIMLEKLIDEIEKAGYEQIELTVVAGNERAYRLYRKLGFVECGRIPNANKYDDNTYADDIKMVKQLRKKAKVQPSNSIGKKGGEKQNIENGFLISIMKEYVELTSQIRILSAVQIEKNANAGDYSDHLRKDYSYIGEIGLRTRQILQNYIYPLIKQNEPLPMDILHSLQDFCNMLLEPASGEELDLLLLFDISCRLIGEFEKTSDINAYVAQLHIHINVCYANVNRTSRVSVSRDINMFYRDEGLKAAEKLKEYIYDKKKFVLLNNEVKHYAMRGARFYSALYDTFFWEEDANKKRFQALVDAINLCNDDFYRKNIKDYDWTLHKIRCIEHMGQLTERGNRWGFKTEQCEAICVWLEELRKMRESASIDVDKFMPESHFNLLLMRNSYFTGKIPKNEYQNRLLEYFETYANQEYDMYAVQNNLLIPAEYLSTLKGENLNTRTEAIIRRIYNNIIEYLYNSVNMNAFNYLQEYLIAFLDEFIEIPGVMTFEDIILHCIAALHPPTYVHSVQVADISKCLAEHLINIHPEVFALDKRSKTEILSDMYHGALCHDFGKITMIDTIFIYGRNLLDNEFDIIKEHPAMGAELLERYPLSKKYADIARQHHIWFNGKGGYPVNNGAPSIAACIVGVADCIDAATDSIGRSYSKGKNLKELCEELKKDSGTRYAPIVIELLDREEVVEDIQYLLSFGRDNNYKRTFILLNSVKNSINC